VVLLGLRVGRGDPGGAGHGAGLGVDREVGLREPTGVGDRGDLGDEVDTGLLGRLAQLGVGVGHVAKQGPDVDAVDLLRRGEEREGAVGVRGVAGAHRDAEDELCLLVGHHVELVAVKAPGRGLAAVAHLGIGDRDDPVGGDALADLRRAVLAVFMSWSTTLRRRATASATPASSIVSASASTTFTTATSAAR